MGSGQDKDGRSDPLERRYVGKAIVLGMLVVVVVAFAFSAQRTDPVHMPGVALDSPFLLDMERAAVVAALVVGAVVFLIRGWVGYFPPSCPRPARSTETGRVSMTRPGAVKMSVRRSPTSGLTRSPLQE